MRSVLFVLAVLVGLSYGDVQSFCNANSKPMPTAWIDTDDDCITAMKLQIQKEVNASMGYLSMAEYFSRDSVNRPGFAKLFFQSASEEREHAILLIKYLLMRGSLTDNLQSLIRILPEPLPADMCGRLALETALTMETEVTRSIRNVIKQCEKKNNDYHLVDYLTADFLDEQYKGQREFAGKLSTLSKMIDGYGALAEFLFDKQIMSQM